MGAVMLERFDRACGVGDDSFAFEGMRRNGANDDAEATEGPVEANADRDTDEEEALDADAAAAEHLAGSIDTLVATLAALGQQLDDIRRQTIADVAEALSPAIAELLPSVLDRGFGDELAAAVARIVEEGQLAEATLTLSESEHDAVIERLSTLEPRLSIAVRGDPAMQPGTARLGWPEGGAHIDRDALLGAASDLLQSRLETLRGSMK